MTSPTVGLNAIVTALKAMPALVTLLGEDPTRIVAYADSRQGLGTAVNEMPIPSLLVTYDQTDLSSRGLGPWDHYYSIYVRMVAGTTFAEFLLAIMNGEPNGDGVKFYNGDVDAAFDGVSVQRAGRESDADGTEFFRLVLILTDKSL